MVLFPRLSANRLTCKGLTTETRQPASCRKLATASW
jgi:hypothetical protein